MGFTNTQYKGVVISALSKREYPSLAEARATAIRVWGDRIPENLLDEWVETWWKAKASTRRVQPKESRRAKPLEVTLSQLKLADELEAIMRRNDLTVSCVTTIADTITKLGGVERAMSVVKDLQQLRRKREVEEPMFFDEEGSLVNSAHTNASI